jgi:hypothetical protein
MHLDNEMDLRRTSARTARFAPALYPAALFLSALMLFAVQPMFAKMVLPRIGGAAAVWSVAMVFFQAALWTRRSQVRSDCVGQLSLFRCLLESISGWASQ